MNEIEGTLKVTSAGTVVECDFCDLCSQFGRRSGVKALPGTVVTLENRPGVAWEITKVGKEFKRGRDEFVYLYVTKVAVPVA